MSDAPVPWCAEGANDGDPVVIVRGLGGDEQRCYARSARARQITVNGRPCEHVAEDLDGTWIYQQRPH